LKNTTKWIGILIVFAVISFIFSIALIIDTDWSWRKSLAQDNILGAAITLFGTMTATFFAASILLYVNTQIQNYTWRRDQQVKDIEVIFEPLYTCINNILTEVRNANMNEWDDSEWQKVNKTFLATKLRILDRNLYTTLDYIFNNQEKYLNSFRSCWRKGRQLVCDVLRNYLSDIDWDVKHDDYTNIILGHGSKIIEKMLIGDVIEAKVINQIQTTLKEVRLWVYIIPEKQNLNELFLDLAIAIKNDREIQEFYKQHIALKNMLNISVAALERHILQPQLTIYS